MKSPAFFVYFPAFLQKVKTLQWVRPLHRARAVPGPASAAGQTSTEGQALLAVPGDVFWTPRCETMQNHQEINQKLIPKFEMCENE